MSDGFDLEVVDELCRAALAARRLGCRVCLVEPDPALVELLALAGVAGVFAEMVGVAEPDTVVSERWWPRGGEPRGSGEEPNLH